MKNYKLPFGEGEIYTSCGFGYTNIPKKLCFFCKASRKTTKVNFPEGDHTVMIPICENCSKTTFIDCCIFKVTKSRKERKIKLLKGRSKKDKFLYWFRGGSENYGYIDIRSEETKILAECIWKYFNERDYGENNKLWEVIDKATRGILR